MKIVDSQVHIWGADTPERPWPKAGTDGRTAIPQREHPWACEEVLANMDRAGVEKAIIIPPSWEGDRNDLALEAARRFPTRFAVIGVVDFGDRDNETRVRSWRVQPGMLGLRVIFRGTVDSLRGFANHWIWKAAEQGGVPITIAPRGRLDIVEAVARKYPALKLCVDHLGCPPGSRDESAFSHLPQLLALARLGNVAVKASGTPVHVSEPYPFRYAHAALDRVLEAFGARRVIWGSDLSHLPVPYEDCITLFTEALGWSDDDLEWVMGRSALEWFGWKP